MITRYRQFIYVEMVASGWGLAIWQLKWNIIWIKMGALPGIPVYLCCTDRTTYWMLLSMCVIPCHSFNVANLTKEWTPTTSLFIDLQLMDKVIYGLWETIHRRFHLTMIHTKRVISAIKMSIILCSSAITSVI